MPAAQRHGYPDIGYPASFLAGVRGGRRPAVVKGPGLKPGDSEEPAADSKFLGRGQVSMSRTSLNPRTAGSAAGSVHVCACTVHVKRNDFYFDV